MLSSIQAGDVVAVGDEVYTVHDMDCSRRGVVIAEREGDGKLVKLNVETVMEAGVKATIMEAKPSYDKPRYEVNEDLRREVYDAMMEAQYGDDEPRYEVEDTSDVVYRPHHYADREVEAIDVIEAIIDGLPAKEGMLLSHVLRYALRAGVKTPDWTVDTGKANNYAHRLITGEWRKQ